VTTKAPVNDSQHGPCNQSRDTRERNPICGCILEAYKNGYTVGRYKLNAVDPWLETAWFHPLNLSSDFLVSKFAFKFNLRRYTTVWGNAYNPAERQMAHYIWVGLHTLNPADPQLETRPVSTLGTYQVKTWFQTWLLSNGSHLHRYAWVFYVSKIYEFLDTFIMLLKNNLKQVSFLHVYHHATISFMWWMIAHRAPGGDAYFSAALNSWVHVCMYTYYLMVRFTS
jgi:hypothetical protein